MAVSHDAPEPTETTGLLSKIGTVQPGPAVNGSAGLENGAVEQPQNGPPLLEAEPESVRKLYLFVPAVALGVNWSSLLALPVECGCIMRSEADDDYWL